MLSRTARINLKPGGYSDVVKVSQYDDAYPVFFEVLNGMERAVLPPRLTAVFRGTRKDGLGFSYQCIITGSIVKAVIDTKLTALAGSAAAEVVLYEGKAVFGTANITISVEKSPYPNNTIDAGVAECHSLAERIEIVHTEVEQAVQQTEANAQSASTNAGTAQQAVANITPNRVESLTETELAIGTAVEAVGIPIYVDDVSGYSEYGLTKTGWYVFAKITAVTGSEVTAETTVTGAEGYIAAIGADHICVAVRFEVASLSQPVIINWGSYTDTFVFKATDLAVRNLDYRTTFYVYDADDFATWEYKPTTDAAFVGTAYYTRSGTVYTQAAVIANMEVPPDTYYTHAYVLTSDTVFVDGIAYYTLVEGVYTPAEVTPGEAVAENTYYVDQYTLTEDTTFVGTAYYAIEDGEYVPAAVKAGETIPTIYYVDQYDLTEDEAFVAGTVYYTESGGVYTAAEVTAGEPIQANTYYVHSYVLTGDTEFVSGKTYYTRSGETYTAAEVVAGETLPPVHFVHAKATFEGMTRNITYRCNTVIDCPIEFILPEIDDDTHGCWFEIRFLHAGQYSITLTPPSDDIKVATEHTQAEREGVNMVDLHYTSIGGKKLWRFMNTHSSFPTNSSGGGSDE